MELLKSSEIRMDETRMTNRSPSSNDEKGVIRRSLFVINSDFWFRHSDFRDEVCLVSGLKLSKHRSCGGGGGVCDGWGGGGD